MNDSIAQQGFWIDDVDSMSPFFMAVVSGGDRWMYVASSGGLTCGRRDPAGALFPYETDDRLCAADGTVGPRTTMWIERDGKSARWEPFLRAADCAWKLRRRLWKSSLGDEVRFEERNDDLGLVLRHGWRSGDRFGFVRDVELRNESDRKARIRLLDGLLQVMPACVDKSMQASFSNLVDAYKQTELVGDSDLAVFRLSSIPIDRAMPNEALYANVAWVRGLPGATLLLSSRQLPAFRRGERVVAEASTRGVAGALLACVEIELAPGASRRWTFGVDGRFDAASVVALQQRLGRGLEMSEELRARINEDQERDRARLLRHIASADGLQATADPREDARQAANAMFNAMRGGTFLDGGRVDASDFTRFLREVAPRVAERVDATSWSRATTREELVRVAQSSGDADLERLAREYLPLTFSRRHGDPSRPWNLFTIDTHAADGSPRLRYEGNWRDIFQNWEALLHSYPAYAEAAICKFVNASTRDGHNPYRVTREGFDWERPDPADPWAHIGYWGDHQVPYLQRLLDLCDSYQPGHLSGLLRRPLFVFADVPYRIARYDALLADPHETIAFDHARDADTRSRAATDGNEARLLRNARDDRRSLLRVGLAEKLLVPILAKLGNFVPGIGVWMNTQRPEWNDANNALVGHGVSVVTTAQLLRHCDSVRRILANGGDAALQVTAPVVEHLREALAALGSGASSSPRRTLDLLGRAAERYRERIYADDAAASEFESLPIGEAIALLDVARSRLLDTLRANRREDGLFHSYNLLVFRADGEVTARRLAPMLEGQVAAIACGALSAAETVALLDALAASPLRRKDLGTYLLYPDRQLPAFLDKGVVPDDIVSSIPALRRMLESNDGRIVRRDGNGVVRFAPSLRNAEELWQTCRSAGLPDDEAASIGAAYERVFDHSAFTGRSGSFFGYEGLGCVYWHMVSKLRLSIAEAWHRAVASGDAASTIEGLSRHYEDVRAGLGCALEPRRYGAFPSDPYSHTPGHSGARQPGMTGQVKEDLVARRLEAGVFVEGGCVRFGASLRLGASRTQPYHGPLGDAAECAVPAGSVAITLFGTPTIVTRGKAARIRAILRDGSVVEHERNSCSPELSQSLFARTGTVARLEVQMPTA